MSAERVARGIKVAVLLGPTGVGKTEVAVRLASELGLDIVSCDSRQVYRGMDIGTAKPTAEQRTAARHWLIDVVDPSLYFSAYEFSTRATEAIGCIVARGGAALVCGGTGLYYRSLSEGLGAQPPADHALREKLAERVAKQGGESILEALRAVDPVTAGRLNARDTQRVIRALEVFYLTGVPISELQKRIRRTNDFAFHVIVAQRPRRELYERIDARVDAMLADGLEDEFRSLRRSGYTEDSPGMLCVGYRELFAVERGAMSLADAGEVIKRNTRRYAKRQMTWFRHQTDGTFVDLSTGYYDTIRDSVGHFLER
jgi:tRNA dimethylallyltransferase